MANCAFASALRGRLSCSLWVMRISDATKGRIPCMTCEYRLVGIAKRRGVVVVLLNST